MEKAEAKKAELPEDIRLHLADSSTALQALYRARNRAPAKERPSYDSLIKNTEDSQRRVLESLEPTIRNEAIEILPGIGYLVGRPAEEQ